MTDQPEEPSPSYFLFEPVDLPAGKYTTPRLGEVMPGRIYEVRAKDAYIFSGSPDWQRSTASKFNAQKEL